MNQELRQGLYDAMFYAERTLKKIIDSDEFLSLSPVDPMRLFVEGLSNVITKFVRFLISDWNAN